MSNYKPDNQPALTSYLCCKDAAAAIEFYKTAFGATEQLKLAYPDGRIGHAELRFGDALLMLADEHPDLGHLSRATIGGSPMGMHLYVPDVDAFCAHAVANGAEQTGEIKDEFYGDRVGRLRDPEGIDWMISTVKSTLSRDEMLRMWDDMMKGSE